MLWIDIWLTLSLFLEYFVTFPPHAWCYKIKRPKFIYEHFYKLTYLFKQNNGEDRSGGGLNSKNIALSSFDVEKVLMQTQEMLKSVQQQQPHRLLTITTSRTDVMTTKSLSQSGSKMKSPPPPTSVMPKSSRVGVQTRTSSSSSLNYLSLSFFIYYNDVKNNKFLTLH